MIKQDYELQIWFRRGAKFYKYKNQSHRLNGPAIIWPDGLQSYWVDGKYISKEKFYQKYYQEK